MLSVKKLTKRDSRSREEKALKKAMKKAMKEKDPRVIERRARIQKRVAFLNKYSLLFHVLLSCGICFLIEWISRHSFIEACYFMVDRNLVFLYNSLIVFSSLMLVYIAKRRFALRTIICSFWLFLGVINGCILAKRVSPFGYTDLKMVGDLFTMQSNYFTTTEAALVIAGVSVVVLLLLVLLLKGPKFKGQQHRIGGFAMLGAVVMMLPNVTNAAVSNHVLTSYFENLAQGYKDYGFVYSFSASVLDQGMGQPEGYSQEAVSQVLDRVQGISDERSTQTQESASYVSVQSGKTADAEQPEAAVRLETAEAAEQSGGAALNKESFAMTASAEDTSGAKSAESAGDTEASGAKSAESAGDTEASGAKSAERAGDTEASGVKNTENTGNTESTNTANTEISADTEDTEIPENTNDTEFEHPNIVCVLLESFIDPGLISFLETSEDPIPNFHYLYDNYSSGYLEVPVVGAGTANTEFEVLTGMSMQFFGLGEYPYKTILKKTNCESIASDLRSLGYGSHVVHDNGGNFYSRKNAFSMMGFDTFTCKEMMDIHDYTPLGTWPQDDIMLEYVDKAMDLTPDQQDFVYVITVESHGDYPTEKVIEDPAVTVTGAADEGANNAWEYYVNQLHEVDDFIGKLIEQLEAREEPTMVVMFGDHLPTMGLTEEDMETGSLFLTQYITWNNFGLEKEDKDMTSYQLLADITAGLGINEGTMFTFHQNRRNYSSSEEYETDMELLQYDILYGEHYVYGGGNPYPATDIVMGVEDVVIDQIMETDKYYYIIGDGYTKWSKVYVDDAKVSTSYISSTLLRCKKKVMGEGEHTVTVSQVGSSETIFRSSNSVTYVVEAEEEQE